ncbi:glycerol-3-phosphate dehydrogenase C-terminal domain-containing protein, partial [Mesorhizobium sp. M2D.F.Ca.ET.148.01.1.1]|uniref:glycerol-3-phosphate dehydrogenase C-terminal domain-containing protein n=1 Tax=Mesorhizobium sp. M2D.F.Ca.ET.148.01.1.1 TaxID=2496665 RepID=UPI000FD4F43C
GGNFNVEAYAAKVSALLSRYPFMEKRHAERLVRCYGTDVAAMIGNATDASALGRHFGGTLYECEVRWLVEQEWACTAEDILWRRTKQGLRLSKAE